MGEHAKVKVEEVLCLFVFVLIWLKDLSPDHVDVFLYLVHKVLVVVSFVVKVSQHKHQLLCRLLPKQFQVALENYLQQAVIRCPVATQVLGPHVDEQHVRDGQRQHRGGLLEGRPLVASLLRVSAFNVKYKV